MLRQEKEVNLKLISVNDEKNLISKDRQILNEIQKSLFITAVLNYFIIFFMFLCRMNKQRKKKNYYQNLVLYVFCFFFINSFKIVILDALSDDMKKKSEEIKEKENGLIKYQNKIKLKKTELESVKNFLGKEKQKFFSLLLLVSYFIIRINEEKMKILERERAADSSKLESSFLKESVVNSSIFNNNSLNNYEFSSLRNNDTYNVSASEKPEDKNIIAEKNKKTLLESSSFAASTKRPISRSVSPHLFFDHSPTFLRINKSEFQQNSDRLNDSLKEIRNSSYISSGFNENSDNLQFLNSIPKTPRVLRESLAKKKEKIKNTDKILVESDELETESLENSDISSRNEDVKGFNFIKNNNILRS
jgi:hypothetical protein